MTTAIGKKLENKWRIREEYHYRGKLVETTVTDKVWRLTNFDKQRPSWVCTSGPNNDKLKGLPSINLATGRKSWINPPHYPYGVWIIEILAEDQLYWIEEPSLQIVSS